jgi:uncharacterized protein
MVRQGGGLVTPGLAARVELVGEIVRPLGEVLVAYSGGVDSALVLAISTRVLGARCTGVIADSPSLPRDELRDALASAEAVGARVEVVATGELGRADYAANGPDRCYFCKDEVYSVLARMATERSAVVLDGFNRDDRGDWRPGRRAAVEQGVRSPLDEAGMGKEDIRAAAREMCLPNWDKPEAACLSSRLVQGLRVTPEALARVEGAEVLVRGMGFRQVRVRDLGGAASVEVEPGDVERLRSPEVWGRVELALRGLGFAAVSLDPEGYRRGKLNLVTIPGT